MSNYPDAIETIRPVRLPCPRCGHVILDTHFVGVRTGVFSTGNPNEELLVGYQRIDSTVICGQCGKNVDKIAFYETHAREMNRHE